MATILGSNNIGFTNYPLYDGDVISMRYKDGTQPAGRWAWGYNGYVYSSLYGADQTVRGRYYVSRQIYGSTTLTDAYGSNYAGTGLYYPSNTVTQSYDSLTFTNYSLGRSISVRILMNIGRSTDDITQSILYRGGTPAAGNAPYYGTHSGGTQIYISGAVATSLLVHVDTIPANTTYTYWHYAGVVNGSGGDGITAWLTAEFLNF
jgi:hypothetical protein